MFGLVTDDKRYREKKGIFFFLGFGVTAWVKVLLRSYSIFGDMTCERKLEAMEETLNTKKRLMFKKIKEPEEISGI